MKNLKTVFLFTYLSLILVFFNSCSKEENLITSSSINNSNSSNSSNSSTIGNEGEITLYKVNNGKITKHVDYKVSGTDLEFQKDVNKHKQIWDLVKMIVPLNQLEKMSEFMIYNGEITGSAGYVVEKSQDLSKWQMGIAINYAFEGGFNTKGELAYTIIHEFGHILTLNDVQLNASISRENCTNYYPGEGCSKENAYINEMYQKYWKDIAEEHQKAQQNQSLQEAFFNKYSSRFVTNYASTNPGEDIAEVFATFITKKEKPNGATIAEKKILLMYNRSELIAFRNHIRQNLQLRRRGNLPSFVLPKPGSWKQAKTYGNPYKTKCRH